MNRVTLYHCNDVNRCIKFIEDDSYLIESMEDGIWLGNGMYFWDNKYNAKYWLDEKKKENTSLQYKIIKALVCIDRCLDLTDEDVLDELYQVWKEECETIFDYDCSQSNELGFILNRLFGREFGDDFSSEYDIIKVSGKYTKEHIIFEQNTRKNRKKSFKIRPTNTTKIIYNVKNKKCILSREEI